MCLESSHCYAVLVPGPGRMQLLWLGNYQVIHGLEPLGRETVGCLFPKGSFQEWQFLIIFHMLQGPCAQGLSSIASFRGCPHRTRRWPPACRRERATPLCLQPGARALLTPAVMSQQLPVLGYSLTNLRVCLNGF
jgi:hypothetical protein